MNRIKTFLYYLLPLTAYLLIRAQYAFQAGWEPEHDTLAQYSEFLYAYSAWWNGELPLWNSYLYGGQEFYLLLNHGLLLNPIAWIWIFLGRMFSLLPAHAFVLSHMTDVVFLAAGGALLAREIYGSRYAAVCSFILLLFCGQVLYWTQQVYGMSVVIYLPWILYSFLKYLRKQTLVRALVVAGWAGISCNVYYPVYQATFFVMATPIALYLFRDNCRTVSWRKCVLHAVCVLPVFIALIIPTLMIYREITTNNSTFIRDVTAQTYWNSYQQFAQKLFRSFRETVKVREGFGESYPLIGMAGMLLVISGLTVHSRKLYFWLVMLCVMTLFYLPTYQVCVLGNYTVPFFAIMRTPGFYCGFVTFCLVMMAAHGVSEFYSDTGGTQAVISVRTIVRDKMFLAVITGGLVFSCMLPSAYWVLIAVVSIMLACCRLLYLSDNAALRRYIFPSLFVTVIASGIYSAANVNKQRLDLQFTGYQYLKPNTAFHFRLERPDRYTYYFKSEENLDPVIFFNIGNKVDGPYFFGDGEHELFVDRKYSESAGIPGFAHLMKYKFNVMTKYMIQKQINDYRPLLTFKPRLFDDQDSDLNDQILEVAGSSILMLDDDSQVQNKDARVSMSDGAVPVRGSENWMMARVISKTANKLLIEAGSYGPGFLLYTDLYRDEFVVTIDGKRVPLLKAMGVLKAVELPPGIHKVEFEFRPFFRYVLVGYLVACGLFLLLMISIQFEYRRDTANPNSSSRP